MNEFSKTGAIAVLEMRSTARYRLGTRRGLLEGVN